MNRNNTNLLEETKGMLKHGGYTPEDIVFIGVVQSGLSCTWREFEIMANRTYNAGFGCHNVLGDLTIAFSDGCRLERGEYDGTEWWEWVRPFKMPDNQQPLTYLFVYDEPGE